MESKDKTSRFTIDLPVDAHKRLKMLSALHGKSMRELVIESIEEQIKKLSND